MLCKVILRADREEKHPKFLRRKNGKLVLYPVIAVQSEHIQHHIPAPDIEFSEDEKLTLDEHEKEKKEREFINRINMVSETVTVTWLLLANPINGEFLWVSTEDLEYYNPSDETFLADLPNKVRKAKKS